MAEEQNVVETTEEVTTEELIEEDTTEVVMKIYRLDKEDGTKVPMPEYATSGANAFDFYSANTENLVIKANENVQVPLGIKVEVPAGYQLKLYNRSGNSFNKDLVLTTGTSIIDSDYRGEVTAPIKNHGSKTKVIEPNMKICQGQIQLAPQYKLVEVESEDDLSTTDRGAGGFGSTDNKEEVVNG